MGITVIHKSKFGEIPLHKQKVALVLSGGALTGGAFKLGGLIALNSFLKNRKITDFDIYSGISAGAFLAALIAEGIPPEEIIKSYYGLSEHINFLSPFNVYYPNFGEFFLKGYYLFSDLFTFFPQLFRNIIKFIFSKEKSEFKSLINKFLKERNLKNSEALVLYLYKKFTEKIRLKYGTTYLVSGLFNNKYIEKYIRKNLERLFLPNSFKLLKILRNKSLYIVAVDLNKAESIIFGWDENDSLSISEAVQAATALPFLYKPARIGDIDYIDAAVMKTAHVSHIIKKGASLVIVYNPFRPFTQMYEGMLVPEFKNISDMGLLTILNQAFRMMLHSRLMLSLDKIKNDPDFKGDIIVFEPIETDRKFFTTNPFAFWKIAASAEHGFSTVKALIEENYDILKSIFHFHGIETDINGLKKDFDEIKMLKSDDILMIEKMGKKRVRRSDVSILKLVKRES